MKSLYSQVVYHPLVFKTKICDHAGDRCVSLCNALYSEFVCRNRSGGVCKGQGIHCAKAHGVRSLLSPEMFLSPDSHSRSLQESDRRDYIAPSAGGSFSSASGAASASGGYSGYADDEDEEQYDDVSA